MAASVVDYSIVAQPNRSPVREVGVAAASALHSILTSAYAPTWAGPVLKFAVCERSLLPGAVRYITRHAGADKQLAVTRLLSTAAAISSSIPAGRRSYRTSGGHRRWWLRAPGLAAEVGHT